MADFTIEQLEALKEGTTPGPWEATKDDILRAGWRDRLLEKHPWYAEDEWEDEISYMAPSDEFILSNPESHYKPLTDNRADMELVASAPELLDALIAEKRAHQKLRAEIEGFLRSCIESAESLELNAMTAYSPEACESASIIERDTAAVLTRILEATDE